MNNLIKNLSDAQSIRLFLSAHQSTLDNETIEMFLRCAEWVENLQKTLAEYLERIASLRAQNARFRGALLLGCQNGPTSEAAATCDGCPAFVEGDCEIESAEGVVFDEAAALRDELQAANYEAGRLTEHNELLKKERDGLDLLSRQISDARNQLASWLRVLLKPANMISNLLLTYPSYPYGDLDIEDREELAATIKAVEATLSTSFNEPNHLARLQNGENKRPRHEFPSQVGGAETPAFTGLETCLDCGWRLTTNRIPKSSSDKTLVPVCGTCVAEDDLLILSVYGADHIPNDEKVYCSNCNVDISAFKGVHMKRDDEGNPICVSCLARKNAEWFQDQLSVGKEGSEQ
jgi:hypothetical protein